MKTFIKNIFDKLQHLQKNAFWIALNESLTFNLLKSFIVIFVFVGLVFQIHPRKSYIYADISCTDKALYTSGSNLNIDFDNCRIIWLDTFSEIELPLSNITVDKTEYSSSDTLLISKDEAAAHAHIQLSADPDCTIKYCNSKSAGYEESEHSIYSNEVGFYLWGTLSLDLTECNASVKHENGEITHLDPKTLYLRSSRSQNQPEKLDAQLNTMIDEDGTVPDEFATEYTIQEELKEVWEKELPWSVYFKCILKEKNQKMHTQFPESLSSYSISCADASLITCTGTGSIDVSMSPVPNQYTSHLQELNLKSAKKQLNFEYDTENQKLLINGFANSATLSGYSLFPDFWNWYVSNIYMAPLTLISVVFTGVTLMNAARKKKHLK